jgi:ubiquinone/menaquinone biosynthesis C-methylase UbiE
MASFLTSHPILSAAAGGGVLVVVGALAFAALFPDRSFQLLWGLMHRRSHERLQPYRSRVLARAFDDGDKGGSGQGGKGVDVLEIGPGFGDAAPDVARAAGRAGLRLRRLYLAEPNARFADILAKKARDGTLLGGGGESACDVVVLPSPAESLPSIPSASVDVVLSQLVLCSVRSQRKVVEEVWRVLKPGGRFVFCEHVKAWPASSSGSSSSSSSSSSASASAAPVTTPRVSAYARGQQYLIAHSGVWGIVGAGCRVDRDTERSIADCGCARGGKNANARGQGKGEEEDEQVAGASAAPWSSLEVERVLMEELPAGLQPHIVGIAVK